MFVNVAVGEGPTSFDYTQVFRKLVKVLLQVSAFAVYIPPKLLNLNLEIQIGCPWISCYGSSLLLWYTTYRLNFPRGPDGFLPPCTVTSIVKGP